MCHIREFSSSGTPWNHSISLGNPLHFVGGIHIWSPCHFGGGRYHRLFPMELFVNFPILSPIFHSSLSYTEWPQVFMGFLGHMASLTLLQPELSLPCLVSDSSSISILPSRNLLKSLIYWLLLSSLPLLLMLFWILIFPLLLLFNGRMVLTREKK